MRADAYDRGHAIRLASIFALTTFSVDAFVVYTSNNERRHASKLSALFEDDGNFFDADRSRTNRDNLVGIKNQQEHLERIRQIQKAFFAQDAALPSNLTAIESVTSTVNVSIEQRVELQEMDHGINTQFPFAPEGPRQQRFLKNVPLYVSFDRDAILPGYQSVLTVTTPESVHMIRRILDNENSEIFGYLSFQSVLDDHDIDLDFEQEYGTLLRIIESDELSDGSLKLMVLGLDRFQIQATTPAAPFSTASVQIIRDDELLAVNATITEDDDWTAFETSVPMTHSFRDECNNIEDIPASYNFKCYPDEFQQQSSSDTTDGRILKGSLAMMLHSEYQIWVALDELASLLLYLEGSYLGKSVDHWAVHSLLLPYELLGLLPSTLPDGIDSWPTSSNLDQYMRELESDTDTSFVRVANYYNSYPIRRLRRLSYLVWYVLLEQLTLNPSLLRILPDGVLDAVAIRPTKQHVLETTNLMERLDLAQRSLHSIHRNILRHMKW